jgi:hypothetical protein
MRYKEDAYRKGLQRPVDIGFMTEYFEMAFKGTEAAIPFEEATMGVVSRGVWI